ncbi:MAG TPA: hypothetical protein PLT23_03960 [Lentisphaeria bacterium]|nr:hypothetical protein [Lentisphaerota bacterium]HPY89857.1 hypothetical protein [Lentisphaeria bacterium]HQL88162.1 hypothetical protein [Lentisphaeria bacterium]
MTLTALERWERQLRQALDKVDAELEAKYGGSFRLRPNRPEQGQTANAKYDGLFSVDAKFSMGYTSQKGPGYIIEMRTASADPVSDKARQAMLKDAGIFLADALKDAFPDREFSLEMDGSHFHLSGDLSLDA